MMIVRYVFLRLKAAYAHERALVIDEARRALTEIPSIASFALGTPADTHAEDAWDLMIQVHFTSIEDIELYRAHPAHSRLVDTLLRPRIEVIKAWNFQVH